tara:strand:- start:568 stop:747 length:180 start_codon:yes stop_codon:yes gene_type:complete
MRKVRLTVEMEVTEEYYQNEMVELQNEILTGEHQNDMMESGQSLKKGLLNYKAKFEDIL